MNDEEHESTDATTEPEKDTTTPGPESVPSEGDLDEDLPGVPDEARRQRRGAGSNDGT